MDGIEKITNLGINLYNKRHPENEKEAFEINPKVRNAIKFLTSAAIGGFYYYVTSCHELDQLNVDTFKEFFANLNTLKPNLQVDQYLADFCGIAAGIGAFHNIEFKDAFWSGMPYAWKAGKILSKQVNKLEEKIFKKNRDKNQTTTQIKNSLVIEKICISHEKVQSAPTWELSSSEKQNINQLVNTDSSKQNNQKNSKLNVEDEINI